jgi:pantoate--beta-alanine ligase
MEIIRVPRIMQDTARGHILRGKTVGYVPTMGALHEGHLSLVRRARSENDVTAVSIFVNPVQFGPGEDFEKYPRDIEGDTGKLLKEEVDVLFMPDRSVMYSKGFLTHVEVEDISGRLCGKFRPGHFRGVATIVAKLLHIVKPSKAYFGQKDFQQTVIISRMVKDLDMDVDVIVCPTIREKDGLAMSSRNAYLDQGQREASGVIYESLREASELIISGIINVGEIEKILKDKILQEQAVSAIDYAGIFDPDTLEEVLEIRGDVLLAAAVKIGDTRLIDNILVKVKKER